MRSNERVTKKFSDEVEEISMLSFPDDCASDEKYDQDRRGVTMYADTVAGSQNAVASDSRVANLDKALGDYSEGLDSSVKRGAGARRLGPEVLKGFVAEDHHAKSFNVRAAAEGISPNDLKAVRGGDKGLDGRALSQYDPEVDIAVQKQTPWDKLFGKTPSVKKYQAKYYSSPETTAEALSQVSPSGDMKYCNEKLAPSDQVDAIREASVPEGASQAQQNAYVHTKANTHGAIGESYGNIRITSDPLSKEEAFELTRKVQSGKTGYANESEVRSRLMSNDITMAMKSGAFIAGAMEGISQLVDLLKNPDRTERDFRNSAERVLLRSADGGSRSGAVVLANHLMRPAIGRTIVGQTMVTAAASSVYDFSKGLWRYVNGEITGDDLLISTVGNAVVTTSATAGAFTGASAAATAISSMETAAWGALGSSVATFATIGTPLGPLGTIAGGLIGGLVACLGVGVLQSCAKDDGKRRFADDLKALSTVRGSLEGIRYDCTIDPRTVPLTMIDHVGHLSPSEGFSFKSLIPFYNTFADLEEYQLRKRVLQDIRSKAQMQETRVREAYGRNLHRMEAAYMNRCVELEQQFLATRRQIETQFRQYVADLKDEYQQFYEYYSRGLHDIDRSYAHIRDLEKRDQDALQAYRSEQNARSKILRLIEQTMAGDVSAETRENLEILLKTVVEHIAGSTAGPRYMTLDEVKALFNSGASHDFTVFS